jgi:UDP-N-acetylglucosamine 2-epimerase
MSPDQSLTKITAAMLDALTGTLAQHRPDVIVVQV